MSGSKRRNGAAFAQDQEADIAVLAIDPDFQRYGNPFFSVYLVWPWSPGSENQPESGLDRRGTESSSFPYRPQGTCQPAMRRKAVAFCSFAAQGAIGHGFGPMVPLSVGIK